MPVIPATKEAVSRRITILGYPQAKIGEMLSEKMEKAKIKKGCGHGSSVSAIA
jgi:hypothetical protein